MGKMRKQEFLCALKKRLAKLPPKEAAERLNFFSEMIDDKIEDGLSEEAAIFEIGSSEKIAAEILVEAPLMRAMDFKRKRTVGIGIMLLIILGSPVWLSLIIAAFAIVISLYAALVSIVVSLWAVFVSFVASALASVIAGVFFAACGNALQGVAFISAGLVLAGLAILLFYGCKEATQGTVALTTQGASQIKSLFGRMVGR